jgi:hypothetical protein
VEVSSSRGKEEEGLWTAPGKEIGKGWRSNGEAALGSKQRRQWHDCDGAGWAATHVALQGRKKESEADQWALADLNKIWIVSKDFKSIQILFAKKDLPSSK